MGSGVDCTTTEYWEVSPEMIRTNATRCRVALGKLSAAFSPMSTLSSPLTSYMSYNEAVSLHSHPLRSHVTGMVETCAFMVPEGGAEASYVRDAETSFSPYKLPGHPFMLVYCCCGAP